MAMNNSLAEVHPELVLEWSEKNLPLTPDDITFGSNKKLWWKLDEVNAKSRQDWKKDCHRSSLQSASEPSVPTSAASKKERNSYFSGLNDKRKEYPHNML